MTIIPDLYDKIGSVLIDMRSDRGIGATFTTSEVFDLYMQRYPDDHPFMEERKKRNPKAASLEGYLNGTIYDYYTITDGRDPYRPAIERLAEMTYRFL